MTALGSMFGLAYGDALGKPTEFLSVARIVAAYGPGGPRDLPASGRVTDDTQMALAVVAALVRAEHGGPDPDDRVARLLGRPLPPVGASAPDPDELAAALSAEFVSWSRSKDNNRAPGTTCMTACRVRAAGRVWLKATVAGSKGCGANMRATPVGLLHHWSPQQRAGAAQLQAAITHGHPTALAASDLTAHATWLLLTGAAPVELPGLLTDYIEENATRYHHEWLGPLWAITGASSSAAYIAEGWNQCRDAIDRLRAALAHTQPDRDPCEVTGEGWIAEEALATALLCFLSFPDQPVTALARAATTKGDSDSIAALTGAFAGAHLGIEAFPEDWATRIEYADKLTTAAKALSGTD